MEYKITKLCENISIVIKSFDSKNYDYYWYVPYDSTNMINLASCVNWIDFDINISVMK